MEIFFSNKEMADALNAIGFETETVTAWYCPDDLFYSADCDGEDELLPITVDVAYPAGQKPLELGKEKPLLCNVQKLSDVFNQALKKRMVQQLFFS